MALWPVKEYSHFLRVVLALGKLSCLYSDVREQDSTGGSTDDSTVLTPPNPKAVAFPNSGLCENLSGLFGSVECELIPLHLNTCKPLQVQTNNGSYFIECRCLG